MFRMRLNLSGLAYSIQHISLLSPIFSANKLFLLLK